MHRTTALVLVVGLTLLASVARGATIAAEEPEILGAGTTESPSTTPPQTTGSADKRDPFTIKHQKFTARGKGRGTDVNIVKVSRDTLTVNAKALAFGDSQINLWCNGAKHTWIGRLTYAGYTFDSDKDDPLQFEVVEGKGYVYLKGKGKITQPDGSVVLFDGEKD